jgi:nitrate reductase gamma subunit
MNILFSLVAVLSVILAAIIGVGTLKLEFLFGVIVPYVALTTFLLGTIGHVVKWARSPVPFHIPTVAGQQFSLPWIKSSKLESPHTTTGVIGRMFLEIVFFRSLFRNTRAELKNGKNLVYGSSKYLWLGAMVFHWSMFVIVLRHFRLFTEPIPAFVVALQSFDGFFQVGLPTVLVTDVLLPGALLYLTVRRIAVARLRYVSLAADYFPLFVIISIAVTGILMRYIYRVDTVAIKELAVGIFSFHPTVPQGIGILFFVHLFLVSVLISYFPFSKLLHMAGVFLSPTRNLANDSRMNRHINPWNHPVKVHTYEEYEEEFRDKMKTAGIPVEKQ